MTLAVRTLLSTSPTSWSFGGGVTTLDLDLVARKPKFFLFNYIQPSVLINLLALFVFLIPAESGEKITLGISAMLNM